MKTMDDEEVRSFAEREYPDDYSMQQHVYKEQCKAKRYMASAELADLKAFAEREYPDDYSMQQHVYKEQRKAKRYMASAEHVDLKAYAEREYPDDYSMQQHVYKEQRKGKRYMAAAEHADLKAFAEREYPDDYSMQQHVYKEQRKGKRYMVSLGASGKKPAAAREYPEDYPTQPHAHEDELTAEPSLPAGGTHAETEEPLPVGDRGAHDPEPDWVRTLLDSDAYAARSAAAGPRAPTHAQMSSLLRVLDRRGGRALETALARALGVPAYRTGGLLSAARAVLNVDGVEVLSTDDAASAQERTVRLDRALLAKQFRLDPQGSAAV